MKRKEHLAAVQKLLLDKNVAKRAKLIDIMMQTIVVVSFVAVVDNMFEQQQQQQQPTRFLS